jgi:uncharacterized damage-inducible protein DinB
MSNTEVPLLEALRTEWLHLLIAATSKLEHCLCQLEPSQVCLRPGPQLNSIANQLAHVAGNLRQWTAAGFGAEPDQRNREREFEDWEPEDVRALQENLLRALAAAHDVISQVTTSELLRERTIQGFTVTGLQALSHTITHLVGHTHQIVQLTRWHLGSRYRFHWTEDSPRQGVPI